MSKLLDQLNDKQRSAVEQTEGPVLILAGAGSGKTRALTFRVAHLMQDKKVPPKNILAVTFTNKAAQEMVERTKKLLGLPKHIPPYSQYLPHIGTFHSICVKILRKEIEKIGYKKSFIIYDDQDQLAVMKRVVKILEISPDSIKPQAILGTISNLKNQLIDAGTFEQQASSFYEEMVSKAYNLYQAELKKADAVDFDDIIMAVVQIFQRFPDVLEQYQELFRYIMVDEYQDTNHAQYTLLHMLAKKYRNIFCIGDDFQSIYSWRGADIQNILNFEKDYPDAKVVLLEQNYRSSQNILDAAYCVISKNVNQKDKKLWTENKEGHLLTSFEARDEKEEARFVVEEIKNLQKERPLRLDDFAILYRTNAQSRALEEAFMKAGMPYKIIGGVKFYQRKEIKDILAYLSFIQNPNDKVSFERIINVPTRGIGDKSVGKIIQLANEKNWDLQSTIKQIITDGALVKLPPAKIQVLAGFSALVERLKLFISQNTVADIIERVYIDSGYKTMLAKEGEEGMIRHENVQELLTVAKKYDPLKEEGLLVFLEEVALVSQTDNDLGQKDSVLLMTLHSAKGLEFEVIFIVGMEEGILPHSRAALAESEMEEERRLCYVGITRAKQKAYLLFTTARNIYGTTQIAIKSRFLDEIDPHLFEERYSDTDLDGVDEMFADQETEYVDDFDQVNQLAAGGKSKFREKKLRLSKAATKSFRDGDMVKHPDFGKGIVISQEENILTVAFPKVGLKKLAKGVAPLERV